MLRQNVSNERKLVEHRRHDDRHHRESSSSSDRNGRRNPAGRYNDPGNVLIADTLNNRVIEANPRGEIVWQYGLGPNVFPTAPNPPNTVPTVLPAGAIFGPLKAERIGDLTLIVTGGVHRDLLPLPQQALFPNGIVDARVIIVNEAKQIVFSYGQFGLPATGTPLLINPLSVTFIPQSLSGDRNRRNGSSSSSSSSSLSRNQQGQRIPFGGTLLIVDAGDPTAVPPIPPRVIEINSSGQIVFQYPATGATLPGGNTEITGVSRLANGDTLVFVSTPGNPNANPPILPVGSILEINRNGQVVRTITASATAGGPNTLSGVIGSVCQLENGNLLIADTGNNRVIEVNRQGQIVWAWVSEAGASTTVTIPPAPPIFPNGILGSAPRSAERLANGDTLIADTGNNRVIRVNETGVIVAQYGLPLTALEPPVTFPGVGNNAGYSDFTTQLGLNGPSDAHIIGDHTCGLDPLMDGNGSSSSSSSSHRRR